MSIKRTVMLSVALLVTSTFQSAFAVDSLIQAQHIAAAGMRVQSDRLRVISQNIANSDSTSLSPNVEPYRRKTITFENRYDKTIGTEKIRVKKIEPDRKTAFRKKYEPTHPAADEAGYVNYPNVEKLIESTDSKEAQRSHEANLGVLDTARTMMTRTIDIIR